MTRTVLSDRLFEAVLRGELSLHDLNILVAGAEARGYNEVGDIITETNDGIPLNRMWDEFQRTIRMWNSWRDPIVNTLTFQVTEPIEGVRYPIENDFEEASEFGEPKGTRLGPAFRMGYDHKFWDLAIRYTWMFLAEASSDQLRALNNQALEADNRLVFTRVLRQIFNSATRSATIDGDPINVYPFYNGDTMVPPKWKTTTHSTGHNHYLTSGAATIDAGDLDAIETHLKHHGYDVNGGYQLVLLVNEQEGAVLRTLVAGTASSRYSFMPAPGVGGGVYLPANGGVVARPNVVSLGNMLTIGTWGPFVIVEEAYIPAGYVFAYATQGSGNNGLGNLGNPVGVREHSNPTLRGLRLVKGRDNDYPLTDSFYLHGMGTGVRHRGAGVVMQITAAGSYTVPAAYQ